MSIEQDKPDPSPDEMAEERLPVFEIRVKGLLEREYWSDRFGGMEISIDPSPGETTFTGPIADQAELYGLLSGLRNKGLTLISVQQLPREQEK